MHPLHTFCWRLFLLVMFTTSANAATSTGTLAIGATSYSALRTAGSVSVVVKRNGGSTGTASVVYTTLNGSAKAGTDYTTKAGALIWASGDATAKTISIPIAKSGSANKTFSVTIVGAKGATLAAPSTTTVTITGSGTATGSAGSLALAAATYSVAPSAGSLAITINRASGSTGAASVSYATANGTALAGTDYTAKSGVLSWANGDSAAKTISVPIASTGKGGKNFKLSIAGASGATLGNPASATVTIAAVSASTPSACSTTAAVWQSCVNREYVAYNGGKYFVRNNFWNQGSNGAGTQCMSATSASCWGDISTASAGDNQVKGYPQSLRGWAWDDAFVSANPNWQALSGMGIKVTALTKAHVHWTMTAPTTGRWQALIDVYFHNKANPTGSDMIHTDVMINQRVVDNGYYAAVIAQGCPTPETIAGQQFYVCVSSESWATGNVVHLYKGPINGTLMGSEDMTLDLKAVIDYLRAKGLIPDSDYLTSINAGWEVTDGGTFNTTSFWTALQNEADPQ